MVSDNWLAILVFVVPPVVFLVLLIRPLNRSATQTTGAKMNFPNRLPFYLATAAGLLVLAAVGPWPFAFYMFLRVAILFAAGYLAWTLRDTAARWAVPLLILTALLYNPFIPARLNREVWTIINIATAALFFAVAWLLKKGQNPTE
jgi:uncharacterized protein DUF6804